MMNLTDAGGDGLTPAYHHHWSDQPSDLQPQETDWRPPPGGSYIGVSQPDPPTPVPVPSYGAPPPGVSYGGSVPPPEVSYGGGVPPPGISYGGAVPPVSSYTTSPPHPTSLPYQVHKTSSK